MVRSQSYSHRTSTIKTSKRHQRNRHWFRRRHATPLSPSLTATSTENSINPSDDQPDPSSPHYLPTDNSTNSIYTLSSYIPVVPLPIFYGNLYECPFMHLSRFNRVCRVNNAGSPRAAAQIFPASLDSYAGIWYDLFINPSLPWEGIRSAFLSAFRPPGFGSVARAELFSIRQLEDEAVNRYHLRMLWILERWPEHGMTESILKEIFINGLRKELKEFVTPRQAATLDEVVNLASMWEHADGIREARRNAFKTLPCGFCGVDGHNENNCEAKKRLQALQTSKANGSFLKLTEVETGEKALVAMKRLDSTRSSKQLGQCQCLQHLCSKKLERNQSMRSTNPPKAADNEI